MTPKHGFLTVTENIGKMFFVHNLKAKKNKTLNNQKVETNGFSSYRYFLAISQHFKTNSIGCQHAA